MNEAQEIQQSTFNLAAYEASETGVLTVLSQKDETLTFNGKPVQIELYGPGTEQYIKAQAEIDRAAQERMMAALRNKASKTDAIAENRAAQIKKLTACTKTLINFPVPGGPEAIYSNPKLGYVTAQVAKFIEDWANFPSASVTS